MTDGAFDLEFYLDLETGEITPVCDDYEDVEEFAEIFEAIENESERYVCIEKVESWDACRDMEDFISTIEDERLEELLMVAIDGKGAFQRFKNVIWEYPEERARMFEHRNKRNMQRALGFLNSIGVKPI